jgi:hypothetical protein
MARHDRGSRGVAVHRNCTAVASMTQLA